jgi:hypothetical protein
MSTTLLEGLYTVQEDDYRDATYTCSRTGKPFSPSYRRPAQLLGGLVWVPCLWCDVYGRTRGTAGFNERELQPHPYQMLPAERPACVLAPAFGDLVWTTHIVQTTLRAAHLPGRLLEFSAAAEKCSTYRELLAVARQFVTVTDIPEVTDDER